MKRKLIPTLALILAAVSLVLSCLALATVPEDQTHLIDDLYRENQELRNQIADLSARLDQQQTGAQLSSFTLDVQPWEDCTGAEILFTATPANPGAVQTAVLEVRRNGQATASEVCGWDGTQLTASVSLDAADGYGYYLNIGGTSLPLSTPQDPVFDLPVYLQSSLSAYCNLVVSDWTAGENVLTLTDAHAQVQLPQVSLSGEISITSAQLVLRRNGTDAVRMDIDPQPSEVEGSCNAQIRDMAMPVGSLTAGDNLELYLEVTLSDGRHLTAFGINWYFDGENLSSAVG